MNQPTLFDNLIERTIETDQLVLYALGEFQSRGKVLAERELPLDRLRGAFRRAAENFDAAELSDEKLAQELERLGAHIVRVPSFVAKHPFRVTVGEKLAARAFEFYKQTVSKTAETKS